MRSRRSWWVNGKKERLPDGCQCWESVGYFGLLNPECPIHRGLVPAGDCPSPADSEDQATTNPIGAE